LSQSQAHWGVNERAAQRVLSLAESFRAVEYVRRIYTAIATLQASLEKAWVRELAGVVDSIDPTGPRDIRTAIMEIENLTAAYEEFSERAGDPDQLTLQA
jgi:hypothetical protein